MCNNFIVFFLFKIKKGAKWIAQQLFDKNKSFEKMFT